jgi:hypothetical protein
MIEYICEASVALMVSCDDMSGLNDNRLISSLIQAPNHEMNEMENKIPLINVVDRRILVPMLGNTVKSCYSYIYGV